MSEHANSLRVIDRFGHDNIQHRPSPKFLSQIDLTAMNITNKITEPTRIPHVFKTFCSIATMS